jgi:RNA-splicing ligase RtcB
LDRRDARVAAGDLEGDSTRGKGVLDLAEVFVRGVGVCWKGHTVRIIDNVPVWGSPVEEGALSQIKNCARTADRAALMADHHKGYAVPIGGVVAYRDQISPSGVGYDIACGNKAVLTDADAGEVRRNISVIMDEVFRIISFGR